jgi:dUTP pyrophosphatase
MNIAPKSGLATKYEINVHAGVIDNGYRGEIKIMLYNHSDKDYFFNKNEKIAQGIIRKSYVFELEESDELSTTIRDKDGFGSTGK